MSDLGIGMVCATICFCVFWVGVAVIDYTTEKYKDE